MASSRATCVTEQVLLCFLHSTSRSLLFTPPLSSSLHLNFTGAGLERGKNKVSDACSFLLILLLLTSLSYSPHQRLAGVVGALVVGPGLGAPAGWTEGRRRVDTTTMPTIAADVVQCSFSGPKSQSKAKKEVRNRMVCWSLSSQVLPCLLCCI